MRFDELVDARDFLGQRGLLGFVGEDLAVDGCNLEGARAVVFLVARGGVVKAGEFLGFRRSGSGGGSLANTLGNGGMEFFKALLVAGFVALAAVRSEQLAGLALAKIAAAFDLGT